MYVINPGWEMRDPEHSPGQACPHTCAQQTVFVVEGVNPSAVAYERGSLEGLLVTQLCHPQLGLQVDTLPVCRLLNRLVNLPAQFPTDTLPYLRAGVDHLKGK